MKGRKRRHTELAIHADVWEFQKKKGPPYAGDPDYKKDLAALR